VASQTAPEVQLARRLLDGDASALEPFIDVFQRKVFHYTLMMCGHRDDAEEVAQDTLMKVFENFKQLREPEHVKTWVFRIARNACNMKRRKSIYAPERELSLEELMPGWKQDGDGRKLEIADWRALPEERAISEELQEKLREAIRNLPEIYRSAILLRDVEELSTAEAAQVLEVTEDVVKTRLHRARLAVRKRLDEHLRPMGSVA
jgi:RNA polymerase sigma-70 factor (ECF subfamily)